MVPATGIMKKHIMVPATGIPMITKFPTVGIFIRKIIPATGISEKIPLLL